MPDHPSAELEGVFHRPFTEQVAFFRGKLGNLVPTERWDDMVAAEHDTGFMVAGAAKADLLTDLAAAVDKAIAEGRGVEEFRRDFRAIVKRNGWTGWTGEGSVKGEAWRVRTILSTNAYTSYAAGRLAQLRAENAKYWIYRHGGSKDPRPQHLDWDGLILPPDHPFWSKFYPPSDWGCSCYVVGANTMVAAKRMGGDPAKKLPADWGRIDPKTGEPFGIGKGWGYAPGDSVAETVNAVARKIGSWDYQVAKAMMGGVPDDQADALSDAYRALPSTADDARRYAQRVYEGSADGDEDRRPLPVQRTLGLVRSDQARTIADETGRDVAGFDFSFDVNAVEHVISHHGTETDKSQRGVGAIDFARLPLILSQPDALLRAKVSGSGEQAIELRKRIGGETYVVVMVLRGSRRRTIALKTMFIKKAGK